MAGNVELDLELLRNRLSRLVSLYDNVAILHGALGDLRGRQTDQAWSNGPHVELFQNPFRTRLLQFQDSLRLLTGRLNDVRASLLASATALQMQDEVVQDSLRQLAERLAPLEVGANPDATGEHLLRLAANGQLPAGTVTAATTTGAGTDAGAAEPTTAAPVSQRDFTNGADARTTGVDAGPVATAPAGGGGW